MPDKPPANPPDNPPNPCSPPDRLPIPAPRPLKVLAVLVADVPEPTNKQRPHG